MSYITVCTPTYNRAHLLHRPFNSLQQQTFKDFEWLVIDDGSVDNTREVIEEFKKIAAFPVTYIYQPNRGRAAALNTSYQHIKTKYVINLDSDDELVPDALEKIHTIWEGIPKQDYDRFWCVMGHCVDSQNKKQIGPSWPEGINNYKGNQQYKLICQYKKGEKSCCRKMDVLKKFPFPQYKDTKFIPENHVWEHINLYYDQFCTNEIFRVYYMDSPDSLDKGKFLGITKHHSYYHYDVFMLNVLWQRFWHAPHVRTAPLKVCKQGILSGRNLRDILPDIQTTGKKIMVVLSYPIAWLYVKGIYNFKK